MQNVVYILKSKKQSQSKDKKVIKKAIGIDKLIDGLLNDNEQFRKDLNSHILPSFYGVRKVFNPHFNGTYKLYMSMESKRNQLSERLIGEGVEWQLYEKYTIYLSSYWKNPFDSLNRDSKTRVFLFGLAQFEGRGYNRYMSKYLYKAKEANDKIKKSVKR